MGRKRKKNNNKIIISAIASIILIITGYIVANYPDTINKIQTKYDETISAFKEETSNKKLETVTPVDGELAMYTLDVGQADSILFIQGDYVMLVDTGTKAKGDDVVKMLKDLQIEKIDLLIGTHPHDDHMGGMAKVINNFEIGTLYTPNTEKENITTVWYMDFLDAVDKNNINWQYAKYGDNIDFGEATIKVLRP